MKHFGAFLISSLVAIGTAGVTSGIVALIASGKLSHFGTALLFMVGVPLSFAAAFPPVLIAFLIQWFLCVTITDGFGATVLCRIITVMVAGALGFVAALFLVGPVSQFGSRPPLPAPAARAAVAAAGVPFVANVTIATVTFMTVFSFSMDRLLARWSPTIEPAEIP